MNRVPCPYCKKLNPAKKQSVKKACKLCFFWGRKISNKKGLTRKEKIDLVNWTTAQKQECKWCKEKETLELDRIVPASKGGGYALNNVQILCHRCNTTLKINYSSLEEAQKSHTEKTCRICKKTFPLNKTYWHKTPYKTKIRENSFSGWHGTCKKCRNKHENNRYPVRCTFCLKSSFTASPNSKYCSRKCKNFAISQKGRKEISCLFCKKKHTVVKSDSKKFCDNTCASIYFHAQRKRLCK